MDSLKEMDIKFTFSNQHQNAIAPKDSVPTMSKINNVIDRMTDFWADYGTRIESEIKNISGLSFKEKSITCYLNTKLSYSNPLTIKIEGHKDMVDTLVHELIHQLFRQNYEVNKSFQKNWDRYFNAEYFKNETFTTKAHILLNSIHLILCKKLFPKRVNNIKKYSTQKDYVRAWEIVKKFGAGLIVAAYL